MNICIALATFCLVAGCRHARQPQLFELLDPARTGITFSNTLPERADFNILDYLYYYDGGGVAVGDVNGDGLPDLYFTSNVGPNHLYLNRGDYRFEDVTARAGVADPDGWKTGVTMADVNGDGLVDIYVSAVDYLSMKGHNVLYVNNGDGTFTDRTKEYGLDRAGFSTQALFFDYDGDGRLDMFLLSHSTHAEYGTGMPVDSGVPDARVGDRLYHNVGGRFVDVTKSSGIFGGPGFGLGVVASDLNGDGCPDLYVADDFQQDDHLYYNDCHGHFRDAIARSVGHTSRSSMGVDAADFNDDGRPDVVVADMLPDREDILKTSASTESYALFDQRLHAGYRPQLARNTLQLNRDGERFSEIGLLAGVAATDWSWAPLFADLDNDGRKDLFITDGIWRRPNDMDYLTSVATPDNQAALAAGGIDARLGLVRLMPHVPQPNHAFRNDGDLTFSNVSADWGLGEPGFSNGAAYVDLNNSGALDLVVSRVNAPPAIYRNRARALNGNHYLRVALRGTGGNTGGIGAKIIVVQHGRRQLLEEMPTRGFQSSVDPRLHFGLGASPLIDTLTVIWPDRRFQVLTKVAGDRGITLDQKDAAGRWDYSTKTPTRPLFSDATDRSRIDARHVENTPVDFEREPLIPRVVSTEGPALAVADVNGDGLDDIYVGGAKWQPGRLFLQQADGTFRESAQPAFRADSLAEDVDALFLDANGDGHPDLYVVSGGNEFSGEADALQDRLYVNDGRGNFRRDTTALPRFAESGGCVVAGDFDGDGHPDLFVGRRVVAGKYGVPPRSYLLHNDGHGRFVDVTDERAPALASAGMVTSAAWVDYDGDGKLDLVVAGDWMPVRVFRQEDGRFVDRTAAAGLAGSEGWWNSVTVADLGGHGRRDLVLGNVGLNSYVRASAAEPARLYVGDFFDHGTLDQILTFYKHGVSYPIEGRDELLRAIPELRGKYPTYASFGASRVEDILPPAELKKATVLEAHYLASAVAMNRGDGSFRLEPLPVEAQFAPVNAVVAADFDADGRTDLLLAGNFFGVPPVIGRYDASYGLLLHGQGAGRFVPVSPDRSGIVLDGQVRHMLPLRLAGGGRGVVVARNDDRLQILRVLDQSLHEQPISPRAPARAIAHFVAPRGGCRSCRKPAGRSGAGGV